MKNALILHGTNGYPEENWYTWLKCKLIKEGWNVWLPQLPMSEKPNIQRYNRFLLSKNDWSFNSKTIIIGHSSGAVAALGLLQALPKDIIVDRCFLIGSFKDDLGWEELQDFFSIPLDYKKIKGKAKQFLFIHSDDDPYCPLDHTEFLSRKIGGTLVIKEGEKHFSISTGGKKYSKFPFLFNL